MRILDFFDGSQSETTPTIGNIVASGIIVYPDDATYEANEQGSPAEGNIYFNSTTDFLRYYNGTTWIDIVDDESLQTIINKTIDADNNTILNLENDNIKVGAAIDAEKIHDGSVDNTEFGHLDGVTSPIQTQLDAKQDLSEKDQPNGYVGLDGSGKISAGVVPEGFLQYQGTWDASTNTPTLADGVGEQGDVYRTSVAGTQDLGSGSQDFAVGDWVTYNGSIWERSDFVGAQSISDLSDVDTAGVTDGQGMSYNNGTGEWQPTDLVTSIDDLSDVDITTNSPSNDDVLTWTGSEWEPQAPSGGSPFGTLVSKQVFTSSGTWNKPGGINTVVVEVVGGGGAGGGTVTTGVSQMAVAAGGAGGGYVRELIDVTGTASETVTVGAGGTGASGAAGGSGGTSSFGAFCSATGGTGGGTSSASSSPRFVDGAGGGQGSNGDLNAKGGASVGGISTGTVAMSGKGGDGPWGGGGRSRGAVTASTRIAGEAGGAFGGGASGDVTGQSASAGAGSNGREGIVIVWEYS